MSHLVANDCSVSVDCRHPAISLPSLIKTQSFVQYRNNTWRNSTLTISYQIRLINVHLSIFVRGKWMIGAVPRFTFLLCSDTELFHFFLSGRTFFRYTWKPGFWKPGDSIAYLPFPLSQRSRIIARCSYEMSSIKDRMLVISSNQAWRPR